MVWSSNGTHIYNYEEIVFFFILVQGWCSDWIYVSLEKSTFEQLSECEKHQVPPIFSTLPRAQPLRVWQWKDTTCLMFLNLIPRVDYPHLEQIWMCFTVSNVCILVYFSRIKELKKGSSPPMDFRKRGRWQMKWILRYAKVNSGPQQMWIWGPNGYG